jgi:SAM-dependent methyltransferase
MENHEKQAEDGILIGNQVDKSNLKNPISRRLVQGFDQALFSALDDLSPQSLHEVGCGEGRLTRLIRDRYHISVLASDFSKVLIEENRSRDARSIDFQQLSIYELDPTQHRRDVIICCEVLEHLEDPLAGLLALRRLEAQSYLISVPREPIWRILNMARFKYWGDLGNTPGHLNHWSVNSFKRDLAKSGFRVVQELNPFPWIMMVLQPD